VRAALHTIAELDFHVVPPLALPVLGVRALGEARA